MKRGMVAGLLLVLLTSLAWGADWYRYRGTMRWNWRSVTGDVMRWPAQVDVFLCYDTTPWSISAQVVDGSVFLSGAFDQEGTKLQFRGVAPGGEQTFVGRGSFNAKETTLNLQAWTFLDWPRSYFGQHSFRGKFLDIVTIP